MKTINQFLLFATLLLSLTLESALADAKEAEAPASPKQPWGDFTIGTSDSDYPWWVDVLLWLPNRTMDLIDIFRIDAGVGPAVGGVVRVSKYGQLGYRKPYPSSVRLGLFGRKPPFLVETAEEYGIGPAFVQSKERPVCRGEVGLGIDLFIISGYAGVCADEAADFLAGLFFFDTAHDDLR